MAETECCGNCRYKFIFQALGAPQASPVCRRYPPLATLLPQQMMPPMTMAYRVPINDGEWCGEWKPLNGAVIKTLRDVIAGGPDANQ